MYDSYNDRCSCKDVCDGTKRIVGCIPLQGICRPSKGYRGSPGPRGFRGPPGDDGPRGFRGPPGRCGGCGPKGCKGDTGPSGKCEGCGSKGCKGCKGDTGPKGCKGDTGPKGCKGDTGPKGCKGKDGKDGKQGPHGDTGPPGPPPRPGPPCCVPPHTEYTGCCKPFKVMSPFIKLNFIIYDGDEADCRDNDKSFAGEIKITATETPHGWLQCNGQSLDKKKHKTLYNALGAKYGEDRKSCFKVPDLRWKFPLHAGSCLCDLGKTGAGRVKLGVENLPCHRHKIHCAKQIGNDIDGEAKVDLSGYSVSMNDTGDIIAIGAIANDGVNGSDSGHVRVWKWNGTAWVQLGGDIDGEASGDQSGIVSMNATGTIVAIGAVINSGASGHVRVWKWNGTTWVQLGGDIDGEATGDQSGIVSMNATGTIVAIGAVINSGASGHVRVWKWNGTTWVQLGGDIDGEATGDFSGWSVSMNDTGTIVAVGAVTNSGVNGPVSGHVRVWKWNGTAWVQLGGDIDGEAAGDFSGWSVSINATGTIVAIGAIENDGVNGSDSGHVRVWKWNGTAWVQLGGDIDGEAVGDQSGWSVSMNAVGTIVAIGSTINNGSGPDSGHVRVWKWNCTSWVQLGGDIDGETTGDQSGWSVNMNSDGTVVAIGAVTTDGVNGIDSGRVRIWKWKCCNWYQVGCDIDGEKAGDQSGWSVSMNADGTKVAIGASQNDGNGNNSGHVRVYSV